MDKQHKEHEKQAILSELENIKSLLVENDEFNIPVLDQIIATPDVPTMPSEPPTENSSSGESIELTLDAVQDLKSAFQAPPSTAADDSEALASIRTAYKEYTASEAQPKESQIPAEEPTAKASQQSLFDEAQSSSHKSISPHKDKKSPENKPSASERAQQAKAKGENPFLPQHIRNRLLGNPPRPAAMPPQPSPFTEGKTAEIDHIVDDLIAAYLPKIEAKLRSQLNKLLEQQLEQAKDNASEDTITRQETTSDS